MSSFQRAPRFLLPALLAAMLALSGCAGGGGDDDHDDDHEEVSIDTAGRLVLAADGASSVRVFDLDSSAVTSYTIANPASAVYTSPGGRYAVVMQRNNDVVQFLDGGIWQEDHGDHLHDYKEAPRMMQWSMTGPRPTHYDVEAGVQSVVFMDGRDTPLTNASARLITDASIAAGNTVAQLDLDAPIHGLAEPVGNSLITVHREAGAPGTLPNFLRLYQRSAGSYVYDRQLPTQCDNMHGSASAGGFTAVGCEDGVTLVNHGANFASSKAATTVRVSTLSGHPRHGAHFIAMGNAGAPSTTRFFAVDAAADNAVEVVPTGWAAGRLRRAHGFDGQGETFFVLDDQGTLRAMRRSGGTWSTVGTISGAIPTMPGAAPWPAFSANGARNEVYLSDPVAREIVVINTQTLQVTQRIALDFSPSYLTWVGITR